MANSRKPGPTGLDDPNSIDFVAAGAYLIDKIPIAGPLISPIIEFVNGQSDDKDRYDRLLPVTLKMIELTGVGSIESQTLLNELAATRMFGGRRQNFINHYIKDPLGWKKLPKKASEIWGSY